VFERESFLRRFDDAVQNADDSIESKRRAKSTQPAPANGGYMVGAADDRAEALADRVADEGLAALVDVGPAGHLFSAGESGGSRIRRSATVGTQPSSGGPRIRRSATVGTQPSSGGSRIRRSATVESQSSGEIIGAAGGATDPALSADIDIARRGGQNLEPSVQAVVQRAIGHDVSDVKIHTDARADQVAQRIQASAFTIGRDIFFAGGQYRPGTTDGMHTLLHESAHATDAGNGVQRRAIQRTLSVTSEVFDATFEKGSGAPVRSDTAAFIPLIRKQLKEYHKSEEGSQERKDALWYLEVYTAAWLDEYVQPKSENKDAEVVLMNLVHKIRMDVEKEITNARATQVYMKAGKDSAEGAEGGFENLTHKEGFTDSQMYDERGLIGQGKNALARADREKNGLQAVEPGVEAALTKAMKSLTRAEFTAVNTYTGKDYNYINKNIGGWGKGDFDQTGGKESEGKANKVQYDEAGMHAGFIAEAFRKLPIWKGTTFRGVTMTTDFLGLTTKDQYKANDYWSSSEAKPVALDFLRRTDANPTMAAICTIKVSNGRDVARMSNDPQELEILLPPGSIYAISARRCLTRGKDDDEIQKEFTKQYFNSWKEVQEFWLIELSQKFSDDKDVVARKRS
jgi:hypothetical protein